MNRVMPAKQNTENIISLEALWILGISTMLRNGKWSQLTTAMIPSHNKQTVWFYFMLSGNMAEGIVT